MPARPAGSVALVVDQPDAGPAGGSLALAVDQPDAGPVGGFHRDGQSVPW